MFETGKGVHAGKERQSIVGRPRALWNCGEGCARSVARGPEVGRMERTESRSRKMVKRMEFEKGRSEIKNRRQKGNRDMRPLVLLQHRDFDEKLNGKVK